MESRIAGWRQKVLDSLSAQTDRLSASFSENIPFPHVVIDGLFPGQLISELVRDFPSPDDQSWDRSVIEGIQVKLRSNWLSEDDISPITAEVVHFFNSGSFMNCLSAITGVKKLTYF